MASVDRDRAQLWQPRAQGFVELGARSGAQGLRARRDEQVVAESAERYIDNDAAVGADLREELPEKLWEVPPRVLDHVIRPAELFGAQAAT